MVNKCKVLTKAELDEFLRGYDEDPNIVELIESYRKLLNALDNCPEGGAYCLEH